MVTDFYEKNYSLYFLKQISGIAYCFLFYNIGKDISKFMINSISDFISFLKIEEKNEEIKIEEQESQEIEKTETQIFWSKIFITSSIIVEVLLILFFLLSIILICWILSIKNIYGYILISAPLGCILRYHICLLNKQLKEKTTIIPIYTMYINIFGLFVLTLCHAFEMRTRLDYIFLFSDFFCVNSHDYANIFMNSIEIGFCGALTTVSTFVQEIDGIGSKFIQKYLYYFMTIISSNLIILVVKFIFW